jgi:hypothetical protein
MGKRGDDVRTGIAVPSWRARLGGSARVKLPNGRSVEVTVPMGIEDGATLRLRGLGLAGLNGGEPGDALVTVTIAPRPVDEAPPAKAKDNNLLANDPESACRLKFDNTVSANNPNVATKRSLGIFRWALIIWLVVGLASYALLAVVFVFNNFFLLIFCLVVALFTMQLVGGSRSP